MISRFCRYLDKVFQWSQRIQALSDPRPKPQISTQSAFLSAMMMSAAGLQSLNALESELRVGGRWENLVGRRKPSADSLARIVGLMDSEPLRNLLSQANHRLRRNKRLQDNPWALRFVALDGHEFFSQ
mgnify:FL=1